jgi:hypothetical protein
MKVGVSVERFVIEWWEVRGWPAFVIALFASDGRGAHSVSLRTLTKQLFKSYLAI